MRFAKTRECEVSLNSRSRSHPFARCYAGFVGLPICRALLLAPESFHEPLATVVEGKSRRAYLTVGAINHWAMAIDWPIVANFATTLASIVTVVALVIAMYFGYGQLKGMAQQQKLNFEQQKVGLFTHYTERYSKIVDGLPGESNEKDIELGALPDPQHNVMNSMRQFFDLCSEEFYLNCRRLIDEDVWSVWKKGMVYHMSRKSFQEAWALVQDEGYDDKFKEFIELVIG